jgi:hypothetical protein
MVRDLHGIFPFQVIGVAVLIFAATTSADPNFQPSYSSASDAEILDNYNEVNEEESPLLTSTVSNSNAM